MADINPKLTHIPKHQRDKMLGAVLDDTLRNQYGRKNIRVVKGDSIRVVRGEYRGVEGKVEKVNTENSTFHIEGIQREKIRGGQVKVPIHSSNVMVISLNLDDDYRSSKLQGTTKRESAAASPSDKQEEKEEKKKEEEIQ
ncbi:MAG TPA: 50S ribosomal protein L24 [Nitrososphaera sp.]|jgi:large subunit ribosomal protein L24|nr:50S ribosomal protein L24 [Nitrososphaera sp.]